jgi:hypothetical protein
MNSCLIKIPVLLFPQTAAPLVRRSMLPQVTSVADVIYAAARHHHLGRCRLPPHLRSAAVPLPHPLAPNFCY